VRGAGGSGHEPVEDTGGGGGVVLGSGVDVRVGWVVGAGPVDAGLLDEGAVLLEPVAAGADVEVRGRAVVAEGPVADVAGAAVADRTFGGAVVDDLAAPEVAVRVAVAPRGSTAPGVV
jgi:hypothetical protein